MSADGIALRMARIEGAQLVSLVDDLRELVGTGRDLSDPALGRLTPAAYPDDRSASRTFADATRDDLLDRRAHDADVVRNSLASLRVDIASLTEAEAFHEVDIEVPASDVDAWLRTLTALRLVIATRLEIGDDDQNDGEDGRFGVYDWLGFRLELLVQAADESV